MKEIPSYYISDIKRRARNKKRKFNLTARFLLNLYLKQKGCCALSGMPIRFSRKTRTIKRSNGNASLDRINSNKGYIKNNVQWVHKTVNLMKYVIPQNQFIEWCKLIAKHSG